MKIELEPGTYIVAVSGGVDSMVMLNMLSKMPGQILIVAHFDHGIRSDSELDRELVQKIAAGYNLPFVFDEGRLGAKASEATARDARYNFLNKVAESAGADAILTAHHQDDMLETAVINMLRGTGRKGLTSLKSSAKLMRPLLKFSKPEIIKYAQDNKLKWREDKTNQDTSYLRNYVRHKILPEFSASQKQQLLDHIDKLSDLNSEIDDLIEGLVGQQTELDRQWFISLDHKVALDVMASWLRSQNVKNFDKKRLEILVRAAKTYSSGKQVDIDKDNKLVVSKENLALGH